MTVDQWKRLAEELDELLDCSEAERAERLAALGSEDAWLAKHLAEALAADARQMALLDEPLQLSLDDAEAVIDPPAQDAHSGDQIGPWRLERELGQGGMGGVWLAARNDGQYQLEVAIKLIDGILDSDLTREQLRRERQILADLDHPDIARLLDGGIRDNGTPWYAMEYVQGEPLDRYCDQHTLSVDTRLRLLARIARAVHHAHTRLVVHRDLKPGNILVDGEGKPHLLDFGIAKLLDAGVTASGPLTLLAAATPAYAAPEQLRGERVGTAADIYALGVIAFELLTGSRPHLTDRALFDDVRGPLPSRGIEDRHKRAAVRGDVDAIVARALAPQPAQRYASAEAMADDIDRHLRGEPVQARTAGPAYRARKFIRRHWLGVSLGSAAVLLLCVALAFSILQTRRAESALARANAVQQFLLGVFDAAQPLAGKGGVVTQRALADKASAELESTLANQPGMRIDTLIAVARVYRKLGLAGRSRALLQRALAELDRDQAELDDPRRLDALLAIGRAELALGDTSAAIASLSDADALARSQHGSAKLRTAILYELGSSFSAADRLDEALVTLAEAERQAVSRDGDSVDLPKIRIERALALRRLGKLDAAITEGENALHAAVAQYGADDFRTTSILSTLGAMHRRVGHLARAEALLRKAVDIDKRTDGRPQSAAVNNLATVLQEQGRFAESGPMFDLALELANQRYGVDSVAAASYRRNLALEQADAGLLDEAESNLRKAYQRVSEATERSSVENLAMREQLARVLIANNKREEAGNLLLEVLADGPRDERIPGITLRLAHMDAARLALDRHDNASAQQHLDQARVGLPAHSPDIPDLVRLQLLAGDIAEAGGRHADAQQAWQTALALTGSKLTSASPFAKAATQRLNQTSNVSE